MIPDIGVHPISESGIPDIGRYRDTRYISKVGSAYVCRICKIYTVNYSAYWKRLYIFFCIFCILFYIFYCIFYILNNIFCISYSIFRILKTSQCDTATSQ
jgi:hypothetical protein